MALNKFMHPRNPYSVKKPDFKALAAKYEKFKEHVTVDNKNKYHLDFKNPECLRALSCALLAEDFGLDVEMPLDRLIPTIPLRINYILWIEDLLQGHKGQISGIDIGCGASCVYPLIGAKKNSWNFVASEVDATNYSYAVNNVTKNNLEDKINVVKVEEGSLLLDLVQEDKGPYDFTMCNPPFYGSNLEAWGLSSGRRENRPEPSSVSTASPVESIVPGGEVNYVKHVIADSLILKDKVRIYTTMLGKKSSMAPLKEELKTNEITNFGMTEFCQGRTMRWGLAWSFDENVTFPKPISKTMKPKAPLSYIVPGQKDLDSTVEKISALMKELKLSFIGTDSAPRKYKTWEITAIENTWTHQRRKRRAEQRYSNDTSEKPPKSPCEENTSADSKPATELKDNSLCQINKTEQNKSSTTFDIAIKNGQSSVHIPEIESVSPTQTQDTEASSLDTKPRSLDTNPSSLDTNPSSLDTNPSSLDTNPSSLDTKPRSLDTNPSSLDTNPSSLTKFSEACCPPAENQKMEGSEYLLKCKLSLKKNGDEVKLEMSWLDGQTVELMHQVLQYFKNKLD